MREIKFRGKSRDTGKWFYGDLGQVGHKRFIDNGKYNERVDPSTVGQYTGLKDKNGTEIYEGDIVSAVWYTYVEPIDEAYGVVTYFESHCAYVIWDEENKEAWDLNKLGAYIWEIEVIGNKYETKEETQC